LDKRYILRNFITGDYIYDTSSNNEIAPVYTSKKEDAWQMSKGELKTFLRAIRKKNLEFELITLVAYNFND
jgi:hypothetical protein